MSESPDRSAQFPLGAALTAETLELAPYESLAALRDSEPVSWVPAINGWLISRRDLAVEAMRNAEDLTVDDPRFTTAAVLGSSMLSLDGAEHQRHRSAFAKSFRPNVIRSEFESALTTQAHELVSSIAPSGRGELRAALAGPMAVRTIIRFLGLVGVDATDVLGWYTEISDAIIDVTLGRPISDEAQGAVREIGERVTATLQDGASPLLRGIESDGSLDATELATETAVVMFGAIETSEGMTSNLLWHLLSHPDALADVVANRELLTVAVEESLRLEPAAAVIDRYATTDVTIADVTIPAGDLVTISLLGANRDPAVFEEPDTFSLERTNLNQHVTFVQGPHACLGLHLARLETIAAVNAVLDLLPEVELDVASSRAPEGLIFRKPPSVVATWNTAAQPMLS